MAQRAHVGFKNNLTAQRLTHMKQKRKSLEYLSLLDRRYIICSKVK